jgi:hypothetical protein
MELLQRAELPPQSACLIESKIFKFQFHGYPHSVCVISSFDVDALIRDVCFEVSALCRD